MDGLGVASRSLRRALALASGALLLRTFATLAPPVAAGPGPRSLAFDSLVVSTPRFSPNADGRLDSLQLTYRLTDSTRVTLVVLDGGTSDTVRVIGPVLQRPAASASVWWNGRRDRMGGPVVPDGPYSLHLAGRTVRGVDLENTREVSVDTQAPGVAIVALDPPVFTPSVSGTPSRVRVHLRLTGADPGDSLQAFLHVPRNGDTTAVGLRNLVSIVGDGDYWAACDSCGDAARVPDGAYDMDARASDRAGNQARAPRVRFDKDILGPEPIRLYPAGTGDLSRRNADSLVVVTWDRHGVRAVRFTIAAADTATLEPALVPLAGDSVRCVVVLDSLLAAEGSYPITVTGIDSLGVQDDLRFRYAVDRTAPPAPRLSPRPGPVSKTQSIEATVAVDSTTTAVVRSGGAQPPSTRSRTAGSDIVTFAVLLAPGRNLLSFRSFDAAGNASVGADTATVVWETSEGLAAPERFRPGNRFQLHAGGTPAVGAELRIYAPDGSMVHRFEDRSSRNVYEFPWNLSNPDGRKVKNGAYLAVGLLRDASGEKRVYRKLVAVLE